MELHSIVKLYFLFDQLMFQRNKIQIQYSILLSTDRMPQTGRLVELFLTAYWY